DRKPMTGSDDWKAGTLPPRRIFSQETESALMLPDYGTNGLLRLVQTVHAAAGVRRACETLTAAPLYARLREARSIVFLLIDGMGLRQLQRHVSDGVMHTHLHASLSAVFPSTTASSITTWMTGQPPAEHGLTGWHVRLPDSQRIVAPLPFRERGSGRALESLGIGTDAVFGAASAFAEARVRVDVLQPRHLVDTTYTRFHTGAAYVHGFDNLSDLSRRALDLLRRERPALMYMYWPEFDARSHRHGWQSQQAGAELRRLDSMLETFLDQACAAGAAVLVSADHGFIDVPEGRCLWLEDHPRLRETLVAPLCGEPRTVYCYVEPTREAEFRAYVDEQLGHACSRHASDELIEQGWFGSGAAARLRGRVGDQVLMMREDYMLRDRVSGERPHTMHGIHGGSSEQEMRIPLILKLPAAGG
ncbi:MAG: alkaline phosphatase family protein, partial [Gammaproteobacteria bacterium]|nr:alkaline phosphatase family protein [Gammaproteobacteria bacterium]